MKNLKSILVLISIFSFSIQSQEKLTIEDLFTPQKFKLNSVSMFKWHPNEKEYIVSEFNAEKKSLDLYACSITENEKRILFSTADLFDPTTKEKLSFHNYQFTKNEKEILITSEPPQRQYLSRLTPSGNFYLFNLETKQIKKLTNSIEPQFNQKFSPNGKLLSYVRNNNIFIYDLLNEKELQITFDGNDNIINGRFDWVYEEEFGISDGFQFSNNSEEIFYWKSDQSKVKEFEFTEYDRKYPEQIKMKYPKAGEDNSIVKLYVYNLISKETKEINLGNETNIYIPRVFWTKIPNTLCVLKLNREQNYLEYIFANTTTSKTELMLTEKADNWLDIHDNYEFLSNGDFIYSSEKDNFLHLYLFDFKNKTSKQITKGNWEIDVFYGIDEDEKTIYYSSSEVSPLERQIYSINKNGKNKTRLTTGEGNHSANFSTNYKYFTDNYSGVKILPQTYLFESNGEKIKPLAENNIENFKKYNFAFHEFIKFKTSDGIELNASLMKPSDFNPNKKYPVFISTYGGPGSQVVRNSWQGMRTFLWQNLLSQKGYIIFMVDNRGTGFRGRDFRQLTYKNLGQWELNDQIEGVKYLSSLSFIDSSRIGIYGWSYGGYMSSLAITKGADYFKTAIAVAPVTDWSLYDNIYTERFMSTPEKNPDGYKNSSPLNYTEKLKGKFLLIHGLSDDNVHFQNSVQLATKLQNEAKDFQTMYYPNKNHGIYGGKVPLHLFRLMTEFIEKNL